MPSGYLLVQYTCLCGEKGGQKRGVAPEHPFEKKGVAGCMCVCVRVYERARMCV